MDSQSSQAEERRSSFHEFYSSESAVFAALNDNLRRFHRGGMVAISRCIAALRRKVSAEVIVTVAEYDRFTPENDAFGEHYRMLTNILTEEY